MLENFKLVQEAAMKTIGITGPSGSGKGHLSAELEKLGYVHLDADKIYHGLLDSSEELAAELVRAFGREIEKDGKIDRKALGTRVLGRKNARRLQKLNKITHKYVCREYIKHIIFYKEQGAKGIIIDAPLLVEARLDKLCDINVFVTASREVRVSRIMARDGIDRAAAERRIDSQKEDTFYAKYCQHIFLNNGEENAADFALEIDRLMDGGSK